MRTESVGWSKEGRGRGLGVVRFLNPLTFKSGGDPV